MIKDWLSKWCEQKEMSLHRQCGLYNDSKMIINHLIWVWMDIKNMTCRN